MIFYDDTAHGAEHIADHSGGGSDVIHHLLDQNLVSFQLFGLELAFTKHMLMMLIVASLLTILLVRSFRKPQLVQRGVANLFEAIVVFLRNEIILPYMGKEGLYHAPYLLTAFFFILFTNLMGLIPGAATATSNISVTAGLALMTFFMGQYAGIRRHGAIHYFKGLIPPNLPKLIIPIMIPVEIIGMCTKHVALAIRLFANMTAGHVVILALVGLIGTRVTILTFLVAPFPIVGVLFVSLLEILIAFIQAYIFTILSAVFIGMAIHQEH